MKKMKFYILARIYLVSLNSSENTPTTWKFIHFYNTHLVLPIVWSTGDTVMTVTDKAPAMIGKKKQKNPLIWISSLSNGKPNFCKRRTWSGGGVGAGGEGDDRGWDGWMATLTRWMWVWVNSGSWWWTGSLACCNSWGRKESDMTERLIWPDSYYIYVCVCKSFSAALNKALRKSNKKRHGEIGYHNLNDMGALSMRWKNKLDKVKDRSLVVSKHGCSLQSYLELWRKKQYLNICIFQKISR